MFPILPWAVRPEDLEEVEKEHHVREKQNIRKNKIHVCVFL